MRYRTSTPGLSTWWSSTALIGKSSFKVGFPLRCIQRLSRPYLGYPAMLLAQQLVHQRYVHLGPLVLKADPLKLPTPTADRDRTVSRRSKPSSRTTLNGEQPYPLGPSPAPGCDEPTSRCQTISSIWTLGNHQPVIPGVPFIR